MNGFLISTSMNKEYKAHKEFCSIADQFIIPNAQNQNGFIDFSASLAAEVDELKKKCNFTIFEKYKSLIFVKNNTTSKPIALFEELRKNSSVFHTIKRIIPLDIITKLDASIITKYINENLFVGTFKIQFEGRLCPEALKTDLFKIILPLIDQKVNLENPDYIINIQAFKNIIGISIMKYDTQNFNFSIYTEKVLEKIE